MVNNLVMQYATLCANSISCNELMKPEHKREKIEKIGRILEFYMQGDITIHEAMKALSEI